MIFQWKDERAAKTFISEVTLWPLMVTAGILGHENEARLHVGPIGLSG